MHSLGEISNRQLDPFISWTFHPNPHYARRRSKHYSLYQYHYRILLWLFKSLSPHLVVYCLPIHKHMNPFYQCCQTYQSQVLYGIPHFPLSQTSRVPFHPLCSYATISWKGNLGLHHDGKPNTITALDEPKLPFSVAQGTLYYLAQNTTRYDVVKMWVVYLPQVMLSDA